MTIYSNEWKFCDSKVTDSIWLHDTEKINNRHVMLQCKQTVVIVGFLCAW